MLIEMCVHDPPHGRSPYDVDGRNYDWLGLADLADMMFIMAYDIQSQVGGSTPAGGDDVADVADSLMFHAVLIWADIMLVTAYDIQMFTRWGGDDIADVTDVPLPTHPPLLYACNPWCHPQIFGRCIASANAPIDAVRHGVRQWLQLGVPASKLVLGLPWYGG